MKARDRDAKERFLSRIAEIQAATPAEIAETSDTKKQRISKMRTDYAAFVEYYFPHYAQKGSTAKFQIAAAKKLKKDSHARHVYQWARGHAKSTHLGIMIPLWLKAQDPTAVKTMVLIGKSETAAKRHLADLRAELEGNQRYIADYGIQVKSGSWEEGEFITKDGFFCRALGRGQSPRGLKNRQHRPDYILLDDIDDDQICQSVDRLDKLYDWCIEALLGAMQMGRGRFIAAGNKISKNSIINKLEANTSFSTSIVNALDKDGRPSWQEVYTLAEIEKHIQTIGYRAAQKELFNNPIVSGSVFNIDWLKYEPPPPISRCQGLIAYCDPSFKEGSTADYKAIILIGKYDSQLYILDAFVRKCSIQAMVAYFYDLHERIKDRAVCDYYMEANFIQDMILDAFRTEGQGRGYQLPIRGDRRNKPNKFQRIEAISPLFERGIIAISSKKKDDNDMAKMIEQLLAFGKGNRSHDDAPDALEGAIYLLQQRHRLSSYTPKFGRAKKTRYY